MSASILLPLFAFTPAVPAALLGSGGGETLASPASAPASSLESFHWGDIDRDGDADAVVLLPGQPPRLLANRGADGFADATAAAGLAGAAPARGALLGDLDGDGDLDLLLFDPSGSAALHRNDAGAFTPAGAETGLALERGVLHADLVDLNGDALADLFVAGADADRLYANLGGMRFESLYLDLPARTLAAGAAAATTASAASPLDRAAPSSASALSGFTPSSVTQGGATQSPASALCLQSITDQATGACLTASSTPTPGMLYPLGPELNIDALGRVGVGTLAPNFRLDVAGDLHADGQIVSSLTSGAPLVVASDDLVQDLNADLLDGLEASAFSQLGKFIELDELSPDAVDSSRILDGSVGNADLGSNAVTSSKILDGTITAADIGIGAVGSSEITDGSILGADLSADAVTAAHVAFDSLTTLEIKNGTLLDADVSSSAGIAGSKIAPYFGSQNVTTTGRLDIGTTAPSDDLHLSAKAGISVRLEADTDNANEGDQPSIRMSQDNGLHEARIGFFNASDDFEIVHDSPNDLHLGTAGLRRLTVNGSGGWLGVNTTNPLGTIHAIGDPVEARLLLAPNQGASGGDSEVFLAEDTDGTFGMALRYDGGLNELRLYGSNGGAADPFVRVSRDNGNVVVEKDLHVSGQISGKGVPFAYGTINSNGTIGGGTGNFSVVWNSSLGEYQVTMTGISDFDFSKYAIVCTPTDNSTTIVVPQLNDGGTARWDVKWWTLVATAVPTQFTFVMYRY